MVKSHSTIFFHALYPTKTEISAQLQAKHLTLLLLHSYLFIFYYFLSNDKETIFSFSLSSFNVIIQYFAAKVQRKSETPKSLAEFLVCCYYVNKLKSTFYIYGLSQIICYPLVVILTADCQMNRILF